MLAGVVVMAASAVLKGYVNVDLGRNATIVIELAVGLAIGMAAQTARRAHAELERAARLAASLDERERLSRQVHDGAIQVLALVARRGREIGGETAVNWPSWPVSRSARCGGWSAPASRSGDRMSPTSTRGRCCAPGVGPRVGERAGATRCCCASAVATELDAAVGNALDNVAGARRPRGPGLSCCSRISATRSW